MHAHHFIWTCALFSNHPWLSYPSLGSPLVAGIWCLLLFLWFENSAHSWTMAMALIILLIPDQDSFPFFWLCYFSAGHSCLKEPCPLREPKLMTQFTSLPLSYSFAPSAQFICFLSLEFYVFHFFQGWNHLDLQGLFWLFAERTKKTKTQDGRKITKVQHSF